MHTQRDVHQPGMPWGKDLDLREGYFITANSEGDALFRMSMYYPDDLARVVTCTAFTATLCA